MDLRRYPKWVQVVPGYIGFVWLVGCTAYMFYFNVIAGRLTTLGKTVMSGVCLTVVTFAISAIWPLGVADGGTEVPKDFWGFVRGPAPEALYLRAVWHKFRR